MGLYRHLNGFGDLGKEPGVIPMALVSDSWKVQSNILEGAVSHLPGLFGVIQIGLFQLEAEAAAFGDLCRLSTVKNEIGVPLLRGDIADMVEEIHVARGFEEFLGNVNQRFWEEEGS